MKDSRKNMKDFMKGVFIALTMTASSAYAVPTLYFDGAINFDGSDKLLVTAALTETTDVNPAPELFGSTMIFSANFDSVESLSGGCFFCVTSTKGNFNGATDALINDLEIFDGNSNTLLTAKFQSLSLEGANLGTKGEVVGLLNATGGSLQYLFGSGELFALQLGLNTVFSDNMYGSSFAGRVDGNIQGSSVSVPEPSSLALLCIGLLIAGFARKSTV